MDPRKQRSRLKLKNALLDLLEEDILENITIERITSVAGVTRPTFYANYADMESIIIEHVEQWVTTTKEIFLEGEQRRDLSPEQMLVHHFSWLFRTIEHGDRILLLALRGRAGEAAYRTAMSMNVELIRKRAQEAVDAKISEDDIKVMSIFYGGAIIAILASMLSGELKHNTDDLARQLASFVHSGVGQTLGRSS